MESMLLSTERMAYQDEIWNVGGEKRWRNFFKPSGSSTIFPPAATSASIYP